MSKYHIKQVVNWAVKSQCCCRCHCCYCSPYFCFLLNITLSEWSAVEQGGTGRVVVFPQSAKEDQLCSAKGQSWGNIGEAIAFLWWIWLENHEQTSMALGAMEQTFTIRNRRLNMHSARGQSWDIMSIIRTSDSEGQIWLLISQFLATLVALHLTPVSKWVSGQSFKLA